MSKKFRSQASSSRAAAGGFGAFSGSFGGFSTGFSSHADAHSSLTYIAEPPDLSRISEPQLVVAFKNLLKKDDITKTKALEDLRDYISTVENRNGTVDDGFLEAWIKVYPRTSIDISRRVRQLAHAIQGSIAFLTGKRIVRHLPKVIGAWLAGLYDNDRPVLRSAQESFARVFATEEKRDNVWKIYQSSILLFVDDVILQQTPLTLSDERTVKPDDAEAKYARVVATAFLLLNRILSHSSQQDLQKDLPAIQDLLSSKSLWSFSHHDDPFVRRSVYGLLRSAISKEPEAIDWKIISTAVIGKSLSISQIGSASDLSEVLLQLTQFRPQIWTGDYTGKSAASKRLRQYIQRGSQGAFSSYWSNLSQLLRTVPVETLAKDSQAAASGKIGLSDAISLMEAFQDGLNSREEPRQNLMVGWKSYVVTANWFSTLFPEEDKQKFIEERISPIIEQYVLAKPDASRWTLPAQFAESICSDCVASLATHGYEATLRSLWVILTDKLVHTVKLSSPEQSKDFKPSQDSICMQAKRLFTLEASVLGRLSVSGKEAQIRGIFEMATVSLLENCVQVLRSRNGKPYGAAAMVEEAVRNIPQIAKRSTELMTFVQEDLPDLLLSPSADRLMAIVLACRDWEGFEHSFERSVERMVGIEPEESNIHALQKLMSTVDFKGIRDTSKLETMIMQSLSKACKGNRLNWSIVTAVIENPSSHGELTDRILLSIIDCLSEDDNTVSEALHGLSQIVSRSPAAMQRFRTGTNGSKLIAKLLYLTESPADDIAYLAESLEKKLKAMVVGDMSSNLEILQHSFTEVNFESLSVESLVAIAEELLQNVTPEDMQQTVTSILPPRHSWENSLNPFLALPPRLSTAITSALRGVVYLVNHELSDSFWQKWETVPRDSNRCSSAFRLASYVTKIISSSNIMEFLRSEERETLFYYLPLAIQMIDDDLSIEGCNSITGLDTPEEREDYMEIVNEGRAVINSWIRAGSVAEAGDSSSALATTIVAFWERRVESLEGNSPEDYRVGEAFVKIMSEMDSPSTRKSTDSLTSLSKEVRKSNVIRSAAWLAVLRDSMVSIPAGTRLCNELIADATGLDPNKKRSESLRTLSLLDILAQGDESVAASVPTQRLVFLVKHLIEIWRSGLESVGVKAEIIKVLEFILPLLGEIYGSHWAETIELLNSVWKETNGGDEGLPVLHASFRLFARLKSMVNGEGNDDLEDAWSESKADLVKNLISTLHKIDSSTAFHQPRNVTADLLCRLIRTVSIENLDDVSEIFPLLTAQSRGIQRAAYEVLHRYIPKTQEQVSFDVALSKSAAKLPDELLSLLLEPPTIESISASYGEEKTWINLRSYLLSWKVVFDHFSNASLTVQENYADNIKANDALIPLLEFTFDFLQKSHGKLADASKLDIRSFEPDEAESAEKEIQWLSVHLYFLSLKYLANLAKTWWIDTKKRIKGPVEAWTEKFISPLIIEDSMNSVSEWIATQDPNEERALSVKVSPKTAELIASITVDEESPPVAIAITLPPAYPLQPALVAGKSRVLVDEKKWRSWLLTIQGVIMFSNGNLVDGLLAFRRNVQGALKGQSECAICYSVISTDMQTPNKRCATCKNTFHSVCLFRWFKSSNQSTCPLCRNNFVYV